VRRIHIDEHHEVSHTLISPDAFGRAMRHDSPTIWNIRGDLVGVMATGDVFPAAVERAVHVDDAHSLGR